MFAAPLAWGGLEALFVRANERSSIAMRVASMRPMTTRDHREDVRACDARIKAL